MEVGIPAHHTKKKKKKTGESQKHVSLDSEFLDEEQQVRLLQEQQQEQIQVQQEKLQELQQQQVQPQQPEQPQQQDPEQRQEIAANPKASDTKTSKPSRESDPKTFKMRVWGKKGRATS